MFFFRLNKITIFDNREGRRFLLFGRSRRAEVKIMSFVTTEHTQLPDLDELANSIDPTEQKRLLEHAVTAVVNSRVLTTVQNVMDDQKITFGDAGYVLYRSDKIPEYFDWLLLVMESDQQSRENAALVQEVLKHPEFDQFSTELISDLVKKSSPGFTAAVKIGKFVADVLVEQGKKNKDDQIGLLYMSLNRWEHYPHLERKRDDVHDMSRNMMVDYSIFGVETETKKSPKTKTGKPRSGKKV